ncbi:MAG: bifunctional 5,10-methylenetetrahydrofolate dehydrogenase/5,10-methenyltetrahydrofolate cyclohydrolase [Patescibacteria group bacterium]
MQLVDGHKIADRIKNKVVKDILEINNQEPKLEGKAEAMHRPNLAIILIGGREDSHIYVNLKEREAKKVGVDTHIYKCEEDITTEEVVEMIEYLNNDPEIDGIFVQLPLPAKLDTDKIISSIDPAKDVDRFHKENIQALQQAEENVEKLILPPVFRVISAVLDDINVPIKGKTVCIVANADIFKNTLATYLQKKGAKVLVSGIGDKRLTEKSSQADILITAVGKPKIIKKEMIKQDAVVIDVGITRDENGNISGDVDSEDIRKKAGYLTPVPGGVGPMTVAATLENVLRLYKQK